MNSDAFDIFKTVGINGGVLAFASMPEMLDVLRAILLVITIAWTSVKIWKLVNE
jgi:hypothetical protein